MPEFFFKHLSPPYKTRPESIGKNSRNSRHGTTRVCLAAAKYPFIADRRTKSLCGGHVTSAGPYSRSVVHQCHQPSSGTLWQIFPTTAGLYISIRSRVCCARPEAEPVVKVSVLSLHRATANQALAGCFTPAPSVLYVGA